MAYTIKQIKEIIADEVKFETLEVSEITAIAEVLSTSKVQGADKMVTRFLKLIKERKDIAPKEEIGELVAIENSVKVIKKPVKIVPNVGAQKEADKEAETVQSELPLETTEETPAKALEEHTLKELQEMLTGLNIPFAKRDNKAKLIKLMQDNVTGEKKADEPKEEEKAPESIFPDTDADGNVRIKYKDLPKMVQNNPYKVIAYVQEQGQPSFTPFTVIFANSEITVLLDSVVVKNSVITCDKAHFSKEGTILSLDDNLCPVAFYAPKK